MLRTLSASLMCLGLVTLGVTISRGENAEPSPSLSLRNYVIPEADADEEFDVEVEYVPFAESEDDFDVVVNEGAGGVFVVEERRSPGGGPPQQGPHNRRRQVRIAPAFGPPGVSDPAVRASLEKMIRSLNEEAERLQLDGTDEEAERKRQSARALEQLLRGAGPNPREQNGSREPGPMQMKRRAGETRMQPVARGFRLVNTGQEAVQRIQSRLAELERELGNAASSPDQRARIHGMAESLRKTLAQHAGHVQGPYAYQYNYQVAPHPSDDRPRPDSVIANTEGTWTYRFDIPQQVREIGEMQRKADALRQAAGRLQQAGLEEQARPLAEQSEKIQGEIQKRREAQPDMARPQMMLHGGPPHQLHQALKELQEQVQALRGDVRQLRELLEKKETVNRKSS